MYYVIGLLRPLAFANQRLAIKTVEACRRYYVEAYVRKERWDGEGEISNCLHNESSYKQAPGKRHV